MTSLIKTGSTLLNLALSGTTSGGWKLGRIANIIGDRSSGKTLLAIEAATLFLNHPPEGVTSKVVYYETEAAFDNVYAESLGMPIEKVDFRIGETVEDLYKVLCETIENSKKDEATFFVIDSLDALTSNADLKKEFGKQDYDRKAQKLSELFRKLARPLEDSNIHLFVISQVRENISTMPFAPKYIRSGGKALDFYATHIVWLAERAKLKATSTERVYGAQIEAKVTKNKVSSPYRDVKFNIVYGYGVDDIESLIRFLSEDKIPKELRIQKSAGGYFLIGEEKLRIEEAVKFVEETPEMYKDLVAKAQEAWNYYEEKTKVTRKSKSELLAG